MIADARVAAHDALPVVAAPAGGMDPVAAQRHGKL